MCLPNNCRKIPVKIHCMKTLCSNILGSPSGTPSSWDAHLVYFEIYVYKLSLPGENKYY